MGEHHFWKVGDESSRLDLFLSRVTGLSRMFVQTQVKKGHVQINGTPQKKPSTSVKSGDEIRALFQQAVFPTVEPIPATLDVLYEDSDLMAINKAQGLVVHPAPGHRGETLVHHLLYYFKMDNRFVSLDTSRPGIIHRLDRGTSGVILIAKQRHAQEELSRQFKAREIKKEYECIVWGDAGLFGSSDLPIGRHRWDRKRMSTRSPDGRPAKTDWKRVTPFKHFSHLNVFPHTGRTHQIRVHLSAKGHPILGDKLYETRSVQGKKSHLAEKVKASLELIPETFLHAKAVTFCHPSTKELIRVEAKRPPRFEECLTLLREHD